LSTKREFDETAALVVQNFPERKKRGKGNRGRGTQTIYVENWRGGE